MIITPKLKLKRTINKKYPKIKRRAEKAASR
jgi:hypothetical protein